VDWLRFDHFVWSFVLISVLGIAINAPAFFWARAGEHTGYLRWSARINFILNLALLAWCILLFSNLATLINNSVPSPG
jgi:hypothetical protein